MNKLKFIYQKGMSIAEVLVAMVIATTVMGASYMIYSNFRYFYKTNWTQQHKTRGKIYFTCFAT